METASAPPESGHRKVEDVKKPSRANHRTQRAALANRNMPVASNVLITLESVSDPKVKGPFKKSMAETSDCRVEPWMRSDATWQATPQ